VAKMNVLDENYEKLQQEIQALSEKWRGEISNLQIGDVTGNSSPILPQAEISIDFSQYQLFIEELLQLLGQKNKDISNEVDKVKALLTIDVLQIWFKEAIAVNHFYFKNYADENNLPDWLPIFIAEQAARPFLQEATVLLESQLKGIKVEGDESAEIHACHTCKGYTKVIDGRKMFKKESPTLLDVKSIHLDYIAQEKGFGILEAAGQGTH